MRPLLVFGASTLARLARHYATHDAQAQTVVGFVVDAAYKGAEQFDGLPLYDWEEALRCCSPQSYDLHVAVGYREMAMRERIVMRAREAGYRLPNIVSRHCHVAANVQMADNNLIMPGAVIEPGVSLGTNNVVWSNATVCHDSTLGNHNFVGASTTIGGHVRVGDLNFFGLGSVVMPFVQIGSRVTIGAQALLRTDADDGITYAGVPARRLDQSSGAELR